MRIRARTILILLLTCGLLWFFFRNADITGVWAETRRANPLLLMLALVATMVGYVLRALRWQFLLAPIGATRFSTALKTTIIGFAASFLLPARAGEVIRPYLLARRERLSATAAFATIIVERLLDLVAVLLLFALFVFLGSAGVAPGNPAQLARVTWGGGIAAGGAVASLAVLFVLAGHPGRIGRLMLGIDRVLPGAIARAAARFVQMFAEGLAVMRQPARLAAALLWSFPLWLSIAGGIWLASQAFRITFPFSASFLVMMMLVVGVAVPTPGAIGGYHAAYQISVETFFGAPTDRAVGCAIVLHAISFVPVTLLGVALMLNEGLTLAGAKHLAEAAEHADSTGRGGGDAAHPVDADGSGRAVPEPARRGAR
ncbi:MAG TPA: lysylphosphatidylglycerol synthase transmembrane domain-containing protein [Vicinamibacterales bacterium]|nr:lysylphosphatidylglycerol synthase transmembrane domain-containing protein [Vicinamibacterales bacterium]